MKIYIWRIKSSTLCRTKSRCSLQTHVLVLCVSAMCVCCVCLCVHASVPLCVYTCACVCFFVVCV